MKLFILGFAGVCSTLFSLAVSAETATDRLLTKIIDKQIPFMVHEASDQPWTGGTYAIKIYRNGAPVFKSNSQDISVSLPLRAEMVGNAGLLNTPIICRAEFKTLAQVNVVPNFNANPTTTSSKIILPIPKVMADCDVIQFPVESFIQQLVSKNTPQWQLDIDKALNAELKKLAI